VTCEVAGWEAAAVSDAVENVSAGGIMGLAFALGTEVLFLE
jgi:hypothetical protein